MRRTTLLLAVFLLIPAGRAMAGSLEDKAKKKDAEAGMKSAMDMANEACGTTITGSIPWDTWAKAPDADKNSIGGYCGKAFDGVRKICEASDDGKAAVKEKIKSLTCTFGGKGKRAVSLTANKLKYSVDWSSSNDPDFVEAYLKSAL